MLGCQLALRNIPYRIVESKPDREYYCKALGVAPRTLEILDHMGLLDEAQRRGIHFGAQNIVADGKLLKRIVAQDDHLPYGFLGLAQPHCEEILEGYLRRWGGTIERNRTLVGLEQSSGKVLAHFDTGASLEARFLVGCDGAHSTVRKALGISFEGERFQLTFLLGDVHLDWAHPHHENWQFIRNGEDGKPRQVVTVIANPTAPGRYRISTSVEDGLECPEHPSLDLLRSILEPFLPPKTVISEMRWSSRYSISHRIAGNYRKGQVFLAGDAAHIHPPIGGLGMNTGLQDAHNLGWKLAAVCRGTLTETILDTYQEERLTVGRRVVEVTAARMQRAMGQEVATPEPPQFDTQLGIRYQPGLLVSDSWPKLGERLPSIAALRRPHVQGEVRLAELFRDGHFLLFTQGPQHQALAQVAGELLQEQVEVWAIVQGPELPVAQACLLDPDGNWSKTVGAGALLVRPDGVMAWQGNEAGELRAWLSRLTP